MPPEMKRSIAFEASVIPRFPSTASEQRVIDAMCFERTLWSAVQDYLSPDSDDPDQDPVIEFCLVSEKSKKSRLVISLRNVSGSSSSVRSVMNALPADYGWTPSEFPGTLSTQKLPHEPERIVPSSASSDDWYVAHIERRVNFVDLPWRRIDTVDSPGARVVADEKTSGGWSAFGDEPRKLITELVDRDDLGLDRYCVPITGALELDPRSMKALCLELQAEAPCTVSIALSKADVKRLDSYRRIAMFWSAHLQAFTAEMANAGFASFAVLKSQFDRFLLPNRFLCLANLCVGAPTASAAKQIALHLSARLGGLRSFRIREQNDRVSGQPVDPWMHDLDRLRGDSEWWNESIVRLLKEMADEGIEADRGVLEPIFEEFLVELPHLYSIDEAARVASLPVADDEGLPGLDTRLVPPFSEPSHGDACPLAGTPPKDKLRVGVSAARSFRSQGGYMAPPDGEWHTISPNDLTKHAFIVGSTGSGKTVTTLFFVRELGRLGIPFLIVEPVKTEYFGSLRDIDGLQVKRVRLEGTPDGKEAADFLAFDPMRLQTGVSVARHASYLKSCFEAAFPMPENSPEAMILEAGIRGYYTDPIPAFGCGLDMFSRGGADVLKTIAHTYVERETKDLEGKVEWTRHRIVGPHNLAPNERLKKDSPREIYVTPSLSGFRRYFFETFLRRVVSARGDNKNLSELLESWRQFFERRFDALATGMIGIAARKADREFLENPAMTDPFGTLLESPTVLELDGIPDDQQKALMMGFIMSFLFERRQAEDLLNREDEDARRSDPDRKSEPRATQTDNLRHVLVVEEAHRILANPLHGASRAAGGASPQAKSVSMFVDMLAEIRAFGQGMVIVEQIPTKIVPEAVKNTNLKIMLRLTAADDREFLGTAMNFTEEQKKFVTSLRAESGRGVDFVVFEQQLDQPRLLMLPLPGDRENPIHQQFFRLDLEKQ
jgi:hypothetical protein